MQTFKKIIIDILTWESRMVLRKYKPKIVAITGSVGKTSTKDAIYVALAPYAHVRRSEKSYNSELGVPLSILGLPNGWKNPWIWARNIVAGLWLIVFPHQYPQWLVLEIGADKPGDIRSVAQWLKPDVVVITRFPEVPVHVEFFESKEHVIEEKTALAAALKKDGLLVINGDDPLVVPLAGAYGARTVKFGFGAGLPVHAKNLRFNYLDVGTDIKMPRGREWTLVTPEMEFIVSQPEIIGESQVFASLAACAVVYGLGWNPEKAVEALHAYRTPPGRLSLIAGKNNSLIIDDTYNSSPVAAQSSLALLSSLKTPGKRIAVFGDMMELGKFTQEAHEKLGAQCVGSCDFLVTVGIRATYVDAGAKEAGFNLPRIKHFDTATQAGEFLAGVINPSDIILIKGSQSVRLEKAVKMLMEHPETASQLLVRQEKEWEEK